MIGVYNYLNKQFLDIMNNIFTLRETGYNLQHVHIICTESASSLEYGLDAIPYSVIQLWWLVPIDIREACSIELGLQCV